MSNNRPPPSSWDTQYESDTGLADFLRRTPSRASTNRDALDPEVVLAVQDIFRTELAKPAYRWLLDPFSSPNQRYTTLMEIMIRAIQDQRAANGVLSGFMIDRDLLRLWYAVTVGWGPAQTYLDDPRVTEVKINGTRISVEEVGRSFFLVNETFSSTEEVIARARFVAEVLGIHLDESNPQETIPVSPGTRMHVSIPPRVSSDVGALVCIRRGRSFPWTLDTIVRHRSLSHDGVDLLKLLIHAGCSFLVVGATGTGKTTLLEAMLNMLTTGKHIITIEDLNRELILAGKDRLWTPLMVDTSRDVMIFPRVVREALRQTPDMVCPGEVRGPEAGAVLQLLMTGHPVMTTIHGGTALFGIERFATLAAMNGSPLYEGRYQDALEHTCHGFDVVILVEQRVAPDGRQSRVVAEVHMLDYNPSTRSPVLLPIITLRADAPTNDQWDIHVPITAPALMEHAAIPGKIQRRIRRTVFGSRMHAMTAKSVQSTITLADSLVREGNNDGAIQMLAHVWKTHRDMAILSAIQRIIEHAPNYLTFEQRYRPLRTELETLITQRNWIDADQYIQQTIFSDPIAAALLTPETGWVPLLQKVQQGVTDEERIQAKIQIVDDMLPFDPIGAYQVFIDLDDEIEQAGVAIQRRAAETADRVKRTIQSMGSFAPTE